MSMSWRRVIFGSPLPTARAQHERLPKFLALPIFASDALSSVAYAPAEILLVLALAGAGVAISYVIPLSLAIAILLAIVTTSYRQTLHAYPNGGGAYTVAKENLGTVPGLAAGAALLIGYILTVSVSIAAGVEALAAAHPGLRQYNVGICLFFIAFITIANLRGVRESGMLFALPTYLFILSMLALIAVGVYKHLAGAPPLAPPRPPLTGATQALSLFLLLRAFTSGCSAMTGVEAVSNGVTAFRAPEAKNASITLIWMSAILGVLFLGISYLSRVYQIYPHPVHHATEPTVVSLITEAVVGRNWFFFVIQYATVFILVLAANTAYAGFPRLGSMLAQDRFLPRQLANIGDRLVYSNGIVMLAVVSGFLIWLFGGVTHYLIPLYAIGVFLSFTLSQAGMVKRWFTHKEQGWQKGVLINGFGAICTGIVTLVFAITKWTSGERFHVFGAAVPTGAWMVVVLIPILVLMFLKINRHYKALSQRLSMENFVHPEPLHHTVCVLVPNVHRGVIPALEYARSISKDIRGVYVEIEPQETAKVQEKWSRWASDIPLVVLDSPYRALIEPVLRYLDEVEAEREDDVVTVILPEFVTSKWWEKLLHNHSGLVLKFALLGKRGVVVTNVRYHLDTDPVPLRSPASALADQPEEPATGVPSGHAKQTG
jgi:amino acid transporter